MGRRLFSNQFLAANAFRTAWGLLLVGASRREAFQQVRRRLPARLKIVRSMLVVGALFLALLTLVLLQAGSLTYVELLTVISAPLLIASGAITALRYVQHQMPNTAMLLIGIGSATGLLLQLFGVEPSLALAAAGMPIFANGCYRLRWALRP
jgi:FlaA1/EpsC-like NDP-sugar epimerase